jgi:RNA polymerase sigma-70 factor (ECF subfamily)
MGTEPESGEVVGSTSVGLLARLRSSDQDAWRRLVRLYGPLVYRWCRRAHVAPQDAADIGQEVFRAVAAAVGRFQHGQDGSTFRGWLWTITRNKVRDHLRRQASAPRAFGGDSTHPDLAEAAADPATSASSSAAGRFNTLLTGCLESIRGEFEARTWLAFWRVAVRSELPGDVAADLGMTANAVRKAKSRVLARLRAVLGDPAPRPRGSPPR